jgi:hypothetical protein
VKVLNSVGSFIKKIFILYISLLNSFLNPTNAEIPFWKRVLLSLILITLVSAQPIFQLIHKEGFVLYLILFLLSLFYFGAKRLRNQEELDIYQGFLRVEYQSFKGFDLVFSNFMTLNFLILFFIALPMLLLNLNHLYNNIFIIHNNLTILEELGAFFVVMFQSTSLLSDYIAIEQSKLVVFTKLGIITNFIIEIIIYITIYTTIKNYLTKLSFEKKLLAAIEDEESKADIRLVQQRISSLPNSFKTDLLGLIGGRNKDQKIARRAVNILFYSKTITFPQVFLYNLHHHDKELQKLGLNRVIELLKDNTIEFDKRHKSSMKKSIQFQKNKNHSSSIAQKFNEINHLLKF